MSQALHPMLNIAIKAARAAGSIINRAALDLEVLKVGSKGPNDYVSEVDRAAAAQRDYAAGMRDMLSVKGVDFDMRREK